MNTHSLVAGTESRVTINPLEDQQTSCIGCLSGYGRCAVPMVLVALRFTRQLVAHCPTLPQATGISASLPSLERKRSSLRFSKHFIFLKRFSETSAIGSWPPPGDDFRWALLIGGAVMLFSHEISALIPRTTIEVHRDARRTRSSPQWIRPIASSSLTTISAGSAKYPSAAACFCPGPSIQRRNAIIPLRFLSSAM